MREPRVRLSAIKAGAEGARPELAAQSPEVLKAPATAALAGEALRTLVTVAAWPATQAALEVQAVAEEPIARARPTMIVATAAYRRTKV
jgi:hypothetical protein